MHMIQPLFANIPVQVLITQNYLNLKRKIQSSSLLRATIMTRMMMILFLRPLGGPSFYFTLTDSDQGRTDGGHVVHFTANYM